MVVMDFKGLFIFVGIDGVYNINSNVQRAQ